MIKLLIFFLFLSLPSCEHNPQSALDLKGYCTQGKWGWWFVIYKASKEDLLVPWLKTQTKEFKKRFFKEMSKRGNPHPDLKERMIEMAHEFYLDGNYPDEIRELLRSYAEQEGFIAVFCSNSTCGRLIDLQKTHQYSQHRLCGMCFTKDAVQETNHYIRGVMADEIQKDLEVAKYHLEARKNKRPDGGLSMFIWDELEERLKSYARILRGI